MMRVTKANSKKIFEKIMAYNYSNLLTGIKVLIQEVLKKKKRSTCFMNSKKEYKENHPEAH